MSAVQNFGNTYSSFSAAACAGPIKLWHEQCEGSIYLAAKNTFLEFYSEERKAIKRSACGRSASADSYLKGSGRISGFSTAAPTPTATPTNRSASPSNRSSSDSDNQSPDASPRNMHQQNCGYYLVSPQHSHQPTMMQRVQHDFEVDFRADEQIPATEVVSPKAGPVTSKKQDLKKLNPQPCPPDEVTTLMIRGIPCSFSQDTLMQIIDKASLKGQYDFFYLPRAGNNGSNLGYAFINFVDNKSAEHCTATFHGVPLDPSRSMKICTISPGDIQGLTNLRKHFRRTAVSRGSRGPVFLKVFSGVTSDSDSTAK